MHYFHAMSQKMSKNRVKSTLIICLIIILSIIIQIISAVTRILQRILLLLALFFVPKYYLHTIVTWIDGLFLSNLIFTTQVCCGQLNAVLRKLFDLCGTRRVLINW